MIFSGGDKNEKLFSIAIRLEYRRYKSISKNQTKEDLV